MIVYGKQPNFIDETGTPYGTLTRHMAFTLGGFRIGEKFVVGSDKPVVNTSKAIEVIEPPIITKSMLPFRLGSGRDFYNSVSVYQYE